MSFRRHLLVPFLVCICLVSLSLGQMLAACSSDDDCDEEDFLCSLFVPRTGDVRACGPRSNCFCYKPDPDECKVALTDCPVGYQCEPITFLGYRICTVCENHYEGGVDINNNQCREPVSASPSPTPTVSGTPTVTPTVSGTPTPSISVTPTTSRTPRATVVGPLNTESPSPLNTESPSASAVGDTMTASPSVEGGAGSGNSAESPSVSFSPDEDGAAGESSSPDADGNGDDDGDGICMDAQLLAHLSADQLVYPEHRRTTVLCDVSGSCATPGHVVVHDGRAMMMKSYCATAGCTRSIKMVNSPRFRRGLRVATRTDGLDFTALAARYETRAEETILTAIVHMGV